MINRRQLVKALGLPVMATLVPTQLSAIESNYLSKVIPKTGESLNVIGMGTSRTFDQLDNSNIHAQLLEVLQTFFNMGGQMVDSSPMYRSAEKLFGKLLTQLPEQKELFAATKVWTDGEAKGIAAMAKSQSDMAVSEMDLMQIHNLRDWKVHLKSLMKMKEEGQIRYIGITTSRERQYDDFAEVMRTQPIDFIQINYNVGERKAEETIFPLAQEKGIGVIVNRPFQRARLFSATKGKVLPEFAKEFDCNSWAQFFLKFIVSHPAVTCVIPATSKPKHMRDNMMAQQGRLPNAEQRQEILNYMAQV